MRWSAVLAVATLSLFSACDSQSRQIGALSESFQKRIDEKERELSRVQLSEGTLRAQLSEAQGKMQAMQAELDEARSKAKVDVQALAKELAPLLGAARAEAARRDDPATTNGDFKLSDTPPPQAKQPEGVRTRGGSGDVRSSDGRKHIDMDWGPVPK